MLVDILIVLETSVVHCVVVSLRFSREAVVIELVHDHSVFEDGLFTLLLDLERPTLVSFLHPTNFLSFKRQFFVCFLRLFLSNLRRNDKPFVQFQALLCIFNLCCFCLRGYFAAILYSQVLGYLIHSFCLLNNLIHLSLLLYYISELVLQPHHNCIFYHLGVGAVLDTLLDWDQVVLLGFCLYPHLVLSHAEKFLGLLLGPRLFFVGLLLENYFGSFRNRFFILSLFQTVLEFFLEYTYVFGLGAVNELGIWKQGVFFERL